MFQSSEGSVGVGLINLEGNEIMPLKYGFIDFISNELLKVTMKNKIEVYDIKGQKLDIKKLDIKGELGGDITTNNIYLKKIKEKEIGELTTNDDGIFFYQENNSTYEVYGFYK